MSASGWLLVRAKQVGYFAMAQALGFDAWHYRVVRENCGYFAQVNSLHRRVQPAVTIDVGCGLGEIISGLHSQVRIGIDCQTAVVRTARLLRPRSISFVVEDEFRAVELPKRSGAVCLLFLNWLHAYAGEDVREIVTRYVERTRASHVIFDVINESASGYRHKHSPYVLECLGRVAAAEKADDGIRTIVLLEMPVPQRGAIACNE